MQAESACLLLEEIPQPALGKHGSGRQRTHGAEIGNCLLCIVIQSQRFRRARRQGGSHDAVTQECTAINSRGLRILCHLCCSLVLPGAKEYSLQFGIATWV